jgi:hypothetical protein
MRHEILVHRHEFGQSIAEPADRRMPRRMRLKVGRGQCVEGLIAHHLRQHAEVVTQGADQARAIGMLVDVQHRRAAGQCAQQRIVVVPLHDRVLQRPLLRQQAAAHAATACVDDKASACTRRAMSSSPSNSASGGMWSSRSIIVGTAPTRCTV